MFAILPPFTPCAGKGTAASDSSDTASTIDSPASPMDKELSSSTISSDSATAPPTPPPRRSIFDTYWQTLSSSVSSGDDDIGGGGASSGREQSNPRCSTRLEPSYLGIYSFASSPITPNSACGPISRTDTKSILRRRRSLRLPPADGRPGVIAGFGVIAPPPLPLDDSSASASGDSDDLWGTSSIGEELRSKRQRSLVHFDPIVTFREQDDGGDESKWFTKDELRSFMAETVDLCHSSAVDAIRSYSRSAVKKAYETAREAGVKRPVLSTSQPGCRALFADPVLHSTDEDAIVHDGSRDFFRILSREIRRVLLVDTSPTALKLFERHLLSMFPHIVVFKASSADDAMSMVEGDSTRGGLNYDLIIVEERLHSTCIDVGSDLTGSELLRIFNEMESGDRASKRRSLKIGVSVSLSDDCESLRRGGADLFWSKPPPKPTNKLRNQLVNALLTKQGKSVFVCGC